MCEICKNLMQVKNSTQKLTIHRMSFIQKHIAEQYNKFQNDMLLVKYTTVNNV